MEYNSKIIVPAPVRSSSSSPYAALLLTALSHRRSRVIPPIEASGVGKVGDQSWISNISAGPPRGSRPIASQSIASRNRPQ